MPRTYNDPAGGTPSAIGDQLNNFYYQKKALIEMAKEQYFGQMADTTSMPKHFGKTIKLFHYLPMLDDANINDQGIDAAGLIGDGVSVGTVKVTIAITNGDLQTTGNGYVTRYAVGEHAVAATALANAKTAAEDIFRSMGVFTTDYATTKAAVLALTPAWTVTENTAVPNTGNLYGSSKDVGTIIGKLPALSETGGRVNRVGFKRVTLEGSIEKFGFFDEYTQESLDFDTDSELEMHINRLMLEGANEITEDALQIDLLNSAGVIRYGGDAITTSELTGEGATPSLMTYSALSRLKIQLDNNRCPKNTTLISGSRMTDTKTVNACRYLYIGTELENQVRDLIDNFDNQAFISVEQYAAAGTIARGEIGAVGNFRIVVVPEMMHWAGAGDTATVANLGYRETGGNYDVFPMLVIGSGSFTTIGFQTDGKSVKFVINHKKPGPESVDRFDPYGETGFMSIKWYYGFMLLRPERIALYKVVAEW